MSNSSNNTETKDSTYEEKEINFSFESEDEDSYFEEPIYFGTEKVELTPPEEKTPIKPKSTRPLEVTKKTKATLGTAASAAAAQSAERKVGPTSSKDVWASSSFAIRNSGSKATPSSSTSSASQSAAAASSMSSAASVSSQSKSASVSVSTITMTTNTGSASTTPTTQIAQATHSVTPIPSASSFPALSAPSPKVQASQTQYYSRAAQNDMKQSTSSSNNDNERSIIREKRNKDFQNLIENEKKASKSPIRHGDSTSTIGFGGNSGNSDGKWRSSRQGGYHNDRSLLKDNDRRENEEKMKERLKQRKEEEQREKELRQSALNEKMKLLDEKTAIAQQQQQQQVVILQNHSSTHHQPSPQQPSSPTEQPIKDPTSRVASFKIESNSMTSPTSSSRYKKEEVKTPSPPSTALPSTESELLTMSNSSVKKLNIVKKSASQHSSQSPSPAMQPQTPPPYTKPSRIPSEPTHSASPHKELQIKRNTKPGGEHREYQGRPGGMGGELSQQVPQYREYPNRQGRPGSESQHLDGRGRGMGKPGMGYEYRDHGDSQGRKGKSDFEVKVKDKEDRDAHKKPRGFKTFGPDSSEYNSDRRKGNGNNNNGGGGGINRSKYYKN